MSDAIKQRDPLDIWDWKNCDLYDFLGSWESTMTADDKMLYRIEKLCPEHLREEELRKFYKKKGSL